MKKNSPKTVYWKGAKIAKFRPYVTSVGLDKKTWFLFTYLNRAESNNKKNKVTVCAHLQNIYNHFTVKRGKALPHQNNYFDIDKW